MRIFIGVLLVILATGCQAKAQQEEVIHGFKALEGRIAVQVTSTGCTNIKSFKLHFVDEQLLIERVNADHCRRMPHKIWLEFDMPNMPERFQLKNKINNQ